MGADPAEFREIIGRRSYEDASCGTALRLACALVGAADSSEVDAGQRRRLGCGAARRGAGHRRSGETSRDGCRCSFSKCDASHGGDRCSPAVAWGQRRRKNGLLSSVSGVQHPRDGSPRRLWDSPRRIRSRQSPATRPSPAESSTLRCSGGDPSRRNPAVFAR